MESLLTVWPTLRALNVNTVLAPVCWEHLEPAEGRFDFTLLDALLGQSRDAGLRVVLLWFGAWKNSMSTYAPAWVKRDPQRFPRAEDRAGDRLDILSPFAPATLDADATAFAAMMRHLRDVDGDRHTVLMVQVENEIGMLPDATDHSAPARSAWRDAVPPALIDVASRDDAPASSALATLWRENGSRRSGNWPAVLGNSPAAEEVFIAWHFARFVDGLVTAGKAEHDLPMFVNAALNRSGRSPGQYPSGGPLPHLLDVWRAGAPRLDMLSPDIYFFDFADWLGKYVSPGHPIFVPEAMRTARASANALHAIGALNAIGFSPFSIESIDDAGTNLLGQTYRALAQFGPEILAAQRTGNARGLSPKVNADGTMDFSPLTIDIAGGYAIRVDFDGAGPTASAEAELSSSDPSIRGANLPTSGGLLYVTAPGEYTVIGTGIKLTHTASDAQVGLLDVSEWRLRAGVFAPFRWLNGDQTNQGRDVHLYPGDLKVQRVRLYKF